MSNSGKSPNLAREWKPVINVAPHPGQIEVHKDPHRFKVLSAGRRWGKTRLGVNECIAVASKGGIAWWVAPSYKTSEAGWRPLVQLCARLPQTKILKEDKIITFPKGGLVSVRSSEVYKNLRGEGLDLVVMDECAFQRPEVWSEVLRPALSDKKGSALFISTPNRCNWFYDLYNQAGKLPDTWRSWQFPTSSNPFIDPSEIELARQSLPDEVFRQEYLAEFIQEYGSVFRNIEAVSVLDPASPQVDHRYIAAVDVATSSDFTVICVMDIESKEQVYLSRFNRVDYPELEARIAQIYNDWHLNLIVVEVNGIGKPVIDHLLEKGLNVAPFLTTHAVKSHIVLGLKSALEHSKVKLLNHEIQKKELLAFEEKGSVNGSFSYSAPSGLHDDCVMALAMAWDACSKMNGSETLLIPATDPIEEIEKTISKEYIC
jgi:phage FluMu gp28-like protein